MVQPLWKSFADPFKVNYAATIQSSSYTPGYLLLAEKGKLTFTQNLHIECSLQLLFPVAKNWNQPRRSSTGKHS